MRKLFKGLCMPYILSRSSISKDFFAAVYHSDALTKLSWWQHFVDDDSANCFIAISKFLVRFLYRNLLFLNTVAHITTHTTVFCENNIVNADTTKPKPRVFRNPLSIKVSHKSRSRSHSFTTDSKIHVRIWYSLKRSRNSGTSWIIQTQSQVSAFYSITYILDTELSRSGQTGCMFTTSSAIMRPPNDSSVAPNEGPNCYGFRNDIIELVFTFYCLLSVFSKWSRLVVKWEFWL